MFIYLEPAQKNKVDAKLVMEWRNDPSALKMFFHTTPKRWGDFFTEYCSEYFRLGELSPLFGCIQGEKVAFLKFNLIKDKLLDGRVVSIGISLNPKKRGKGYGSAIIQKTALHLLSRGFDTVLAEVKQSNLASIKAFEKAGFVLLDALNKKVEDTGEVVPIYRYVKHKPKQPIQKMKNKKQSVFVIAEAGSNWRCGTPARDMAMAKALIDVAVDAGADAVKFQTYKPETVYVSNAGNSDYLAEAGIQESITDIFKDLSMPYEMIPQLAKYCRDKKIEFMSTPFSVADAKAVDPFVKKHKLASYEISHASLIEFMAKTGKPLILSTGGATLMDIEWALNHFYKMGGKAASLMQCTAKYPAPLTTLNLKVIPELIAHFGVPVGLSDHSRDPLIGPVGAVAMGATIIEKHYTLHNKLPGPDHSFALTPDELKQMITAIRQMEQALGTGGKSVQKEEIELRHYAQRSVQAIKKINKGDVFREGKNVGILRPGNQKQGLHPKYLSEIEGKKATRVITLGSGIQEGDYQ